MVAPLADADPGPNPTTLLKSSPLRRPRVLSGIQPTSDSFHLGNYLGALQNWVALQDEFEAFYCVVDLHALTVEWEPAVLRERCRRSAAQLLAIGLDPASVRSSSRATSANTPSWPGSSPASPASARRAG